MSKTRKILTTLTMVAIATTASLTAVSSAQAHWTGFVHSHFVNPGLLGPGVLIPPPGPGHNHASHHHHENHNHGLKSGQAAALGLLGGVIIGTLASKQQQAPAPAASLPTEHYLYCDKKYKTFVWQTNTFTGFDGNQHYCNSPYVY